MKKLTLPFIFSLLLHLVLINLGLEKTPSPNPRRVWIETPVYSSKKNHSTITTNSKQSGVSLSTKKNEGSSSLEKQKGDTDLSVIQGKIQNAIEEALIEFPIRSSQKLNLKIEVDYLSGSVVSFDWLEGLDVDSTLKKRIETSIRKITFLADLPKTNENVFLQIPILIQE